VIAKLNNLRMSPRKVMLVAKAVRRQDYVSARRILKFAEKLAAEPLLKLLESAKASAKREGLKEDTLVVSEVLVGSGTTLKRGRFASRGGYHRILKRTSNITIKLTGEKTAEPASEPGKLKKGKVKKDGK